MSNSIKEQHSKTTFKAVLRHHRPKTGTLETLFQVASPDGLELLSFFCWTYTQKHMRANPHVQLSSSSFYTFTLALRLHSVNKSNQYWSSYMAPFMQLSSRYPCTNHVLVRVFIFASAYVAIENAYALITHAGNDVMGQSAHPPP